MNRQKRLLSAALAVALLGSSLALGQVKRPEQIKYPELPEFKIPEPTRVVLDNGMVVILVEDHELPLVDASVRIHTGARLEPADKVGLAGLAGAVLRSGGTRSMTGDKLDDFLEGKAASIETSIGTEFGSASMNCLKQDFPKVLEVFADVLRNPVFDENKLEVARTQTISGLSRQNDQPIQIMFREFNEIIYGDDSPYSRPATYESVGKVTRGDLVNWHKTYFHPNRVILGLVGDFDTQKTLELVKKVFGDWKKGPDPQPVNVAYQKRVEPAVHYVEKNDMTQSNIIMGHLGIERRNPDYHAVEVLNRVMRNSIGGRLFNEIRTAKGLAYAVGGSIDSDWDHEGATNIWMTTKVETTGEGIDALVEEARKLTSMPPTEQEVADAKAAILNSFIFNVDSRREILNRQLTYDYYGYPLDWLVRYRKGVEAVTVDQVRQAAAKYMHPDQFAILVIGPKEGQDRPLSEFGTVIARDIAIPEPQAERVAASSDTRKKGQELLAKAVQRIGGAAAVDALASMSQTSSVVAVTPQGELAVKVKVVIDYPGSMRQELTLPFGKMVQVVTGDDGFIVAPQGTQDMPASQRENQRKSLNRIPLIMLKNRNNPGFEALAMGQGEVNGEQVDLLQVEQDGELSVYGLDKSGRIVQVSYRGQDLTGTPGDVVQVLSDFRPVGTVTLSHASVATIDGKPMLDTKVDEYQVNGTVAADAFARPEAMTAQGGN